jgi:hypothetical protein
MKNFKKSDVEATRVECLHSKIKDTNWIEAIYKDSMKIVVASTHLVNIFLTCQKSLELKIHQLKPSPPHPQAGRPSGTPEILEGSKPTPFSCMENRP